MRQEIKKALENTPLNTSEKVNVLIPVSRLIGNPAKEGFFGYYAPGLPKTHDGSPILSFGQLEMRPLKDQTEDQPKSLFPESQKTVPPSYDMRPLREILGDKREPLDPTAFSNAAERVVLIHQERRAS